MIMCAPCEPVASMNALSCNTLQDQSNSCDCHVGLWHAGTEVLQSYCPIAWEYDERQEHCQQVYGFTCQCQRCKVSCKLRLERPRSCTVHFQTCNRCLCKVVTACIRVAGATLQLIDMRLSRCLQTVVFQNTDFRALSHTSFFPDDVTCV